MPEFSSQCQVQHFSPFALLILEVANAEECPNKPSEGFRTNRVLTFPQACVYADFANVVTEYRKVKHTLDIHV